MRVQWNHGMAIAVLITRLAAPTAMAEHGRTGILTDRLTPKQLKIWKSIESVVLANDRDGHPAYPKLRNLWNYAETSGRIIFIELEDRKNDEVTFAGGARVEEIGPTGTPDRIVVRLNLWLLDSCTGWMTYETANRKTESHSLRGLDRNRRYVQVLGHELAHVFWLLTDSNYVRMFEELRQKNRAFNEYWRLRHRGTASDTPPQNLVDRIQVLRGELEKPVEKMEMELCHELRSR
jgi:hypothetical protein